MVVLCRLGEDVAQLRAQLAQGIGEARHWNHSTFKDIAGIWHMLVPV